ncbi:hypothetical protein [Seonamhaeicola sp. ML3]|uniref:hypothetical protein n=1 Tax=Seonamhaeicola sp. ML3 TaxID=2937786 RepID=UPI00200CBFB3|nr:hypothetical protein [Seonamhaeicola sp. ML3]
MKFIRIVLFVFIAGVSMQVEAQTVYITKTGKKYHKSKCHYLKYSKKEITLEKALKYGYSACSVCKPEKGSKGKLRNNLSNAKVNSPSSKNTTSTRCIGITKSGSRCKRMTKNANGRCYQH